eukprot:TRINITY_DN2036_c0_g1_i1.p1 TRINITY_DN2036_c0_g1~~TRINITY_DN2036_c0_g1_i1.p1  ORF type:complete len:349 (+),score=85.52 TRINITY_DN2036_c0_g1_i1:71-1117(+)
MESQPFQHPAKYDTNLITLTRHTIAAQRKHGHAQGHLTLLLASIQLGCKFVCSSVMKAGIARLTGLDGSVNVQGEDVKKLDVLANEVFINALRSSGQVSIMVSEENEQFIVVDEPQRGPYAVVFDPLDGSSNIDAGVSIGTIFGIYRIPDGAPLDENVVLRPGSEMVAAGYAMYGSSCVLVLSTGDGVNGFTLDPSIGEFILTHENISIKPQSSIYSVNEGNSIFWDEPTRQYVESVKNPKSRKPHSARYIGSMVADVHRTLLYGGVFMYPGDSKSPNGKLRILYECFPMAFLIEQAGGKATSGRHRILDIQPKKLHERCPIFLGSKNDIEYIEQLYKDADAASAKSS